MLVRICNCLFPLWMITCLCVCWLCCLFIDNTYEAMLLLVDLFKKLAMYTCLYVCTHILFSSRCFKYSHSCHFFPLWILILGIGLAGSLPPQSGLIAASSSSVSLSFSLSVLGWYSVKEFSLEKNNTVTFQFPDIPFFFSFLSTNNILKIIFR